MDHEEKNYFGLKFWLITIFFFPFSLIYVVIKIMDYKNEQAREFGEKAWLEQKVRKYFGLKFWLLSICFFPFSIIYVCVKIAKYKMLQKELENIRKADSNKFQELYYKELYEKQRRENEKELAQEKQKENSE